MALKAEGEKLAVGAVVRKSVSAAKSIRPTICAQTNEQFASAQFAGACLQGHPVFTFSAQSDMPAAMECAFVRVTAPATEPQAIEIAITMASAKRISP